jgi:hypothetical protein
MPSLLSDEKESPLLKSNLIKFFSENKNYTNILFNIIERRNPCSLRLMEWFVINYSKNNPVIYKVKGVQFNVFKSYKNYLSSFSKDNFDPFKREKKGNGTKDSKFKIKNQVTGEVVETTVCQLMFFKWIFINNIHEYIQNNITTIKDSMKNQSKKKEVKKEGIPKVKKKTTVSVPTQKKKDITVKKVVVSSKPGTITKTATKPFGKVTLKFK